MIIAWFLAFLRKLVWLVTPPKPEDLAVVNPNLKCPMCGYAKGEIRAVIQEVGLANQPRELRKRKPFIQHRCLVCGARWFEDPVVKVTAARIYPAVPRNEIEKSEDRDRILIPEP